MGSPRVRAAGERARAPLSDAELRRQLGRFRDFKAATALATSYDEERRLLVDFVQGLGISGDELP